MATFTGKEIRNTYDAILKLEDNDALTSSYKKITDGLGNETPLSISETAVKANTNIEATGFKTPTGTSNQFLKANGTVDTNSYLSTETDPIFTASPAGGITTANINNWNSAHTHSNAAHAPSDAEKNVNADWNAVSGDAQILNKPVAFTPIAHTHVVADITDFPSSMTPTAHTHAISEVTGLQTALDGKEDAFIKGTAFNKNFGNKVGTVAEGNDSRILNGETAFGWGDHSQAGYITTQSDNQVLSISGHDVTISNGNTITIPDNDTTYTSGDFNHDDLAGYQSNEHINWTANQNGNKHIHPNNYVDTNTQLSDADIATMGYIKTFTDTNTQLTDAEIAAMGYIKTETDSQTLSISGHDLTISNGNTITIPDNDTTYTSGDFTHNDLAGYVAKEHIDWSATNALNIHPDNYTDTNTQLSDAEIGALGYIKSFTNTQLTEEQVQDFIGGMVTANTETNISVTYDDATGKLNFVSSDTQLTESQIATMGFIKTYVNTQLSDADIAAMGYIKTYTDTNTQLTQAQVGTFAEAEGFIKTYVDTNTQLSDAEIAAMGYIKTDTNTQLSDADIAAMGYIKSFTDTNTQLTQAQVGAYAVAEGFIKSYVNTQLSDADIAAMGYIKTYTDTNTQLTQSEVGAFATAEGFIKTFTDTQRSDAEIQAIIDTNSAGFLTSETDSQTLSISGHDVTISNGNTITIPDNNTTYVSGDFTHNNLSGVDADEHIDWTVSQTKNIHADNYTDTNTQLTQSQVGTYATNEGFIKSFTDTNTQRSDEDIRHISASQWVNGTNTTVVYDNGANTIKIDSPNTQRSDAEIQAIIDTNSAGFITTQSDSQSLSISGHTISLTNGGSVTVPDNNTTYVAADFNHNDLSGVAANEHIDWTVDQGTTNIHANNYTNTNTFRAIHDTPVNGATTTSISSNWAFDNVKTAVPANAVFTDNNTTYVSSDFNHDDLTGFVAKEHIDWTADQGSVNIHAGNYTNTNTHRPITSTPTDGATSTSISADWAFDNVKKAVPANAVFTDTQLTEAEITTMGFIQTQSDSQSLSISGHDLTISNGNTVTIPDNNTTYVSSDFNHDDLTGFVAKEHLDWTADQGANNIHANNYSNTQRAIHDTPVNGATTTSISSNWAFDNVKTAVPANAVFTDNNTTYVSSDFTHDDLTGFVANEHIDWTTDRGATNIHPNNYTNSWRGITSTPTTGATGTSISSGWAYDNVKTAVPANAVFTDNNTTYVSSDFNHDDLTGFVVKEHLDWTVDQGSNNIHANNYTNTNTWRPIDDTPVNGATTESISSNWAFDNVKTAVPANALFTDTNTTYTSSDFNHDDLTGFVAKEHLDWTADQGSNNIHANNYTDTNTHRAITSTPTDGATTTSISADWAFDNVKTAVPAGAVFTDTNTNTQLTQAQVGAYATAEGFIKSYTDTNTQLSQSQVGAYATAEGFIKSYTDTNTQRTDEEIRDVASAQWIDGNNTSVVKDDAGNTIKINSVNTFRAITSSPVSGANTTSISSGWAFLNRPAITTNGTVPALASGITAAEVRSLIGAGTSTTNNVTTNITTTHFSTSVRVNSSDGTNGTINAASASAAGVVTNGAQTFGGTKTFNGLTNNGYTTLNGNVTAKGILDVYNSSGAYQFQKIDPASAQVTIGDMSGLSWGTHIKVEGNTGNIKWFTGTTENMRLTSSSTLHVDGDIIAYSATISDRRLKENIHTIEDATETVNKLRGVSYDWKSGSRKGQKEIGLIAQEVKEVLPFLVKEHELPLTEGVEEGTLYNTVDYEKIVGLLIEDSKAKDLRIKELERKLESLTEVVEKIASLK